MLSRKTGPSNAKFFQPKGPPGLPRNPLSGANANESPNVTLLVIVRSYGRAAIGRSWMIIQLMPN